MVVNSPSVWIWESPSWQIWLVTALSSKALRVSPMNVSRCWDDCHMSHIIMISRCYITDHWLLTAASHQSLVSGIWWNLPPAFSSWWRSLLAALSALWTRPKCPGQGLGLGQGRRASHNCYIENSSEMDISSSNKSTGHRSFCFIIELGLGN